MKKIDIKNPSIKDSGMCLSKLNKNGYQGSCLSSDQRQVEDCKNKLIHGETLSRKEGETNLVNDKELTEDYSTQSG
jgi:hypothetical protein